MCILGPKACTHTYALLDEGSTISLIDHKLTRDVEIRGQALKIALKGISRREVTRTNCEKVDIKLQGTLLTYEIRNIIAMQNLDLPSQTLPIEITDLVERAENIVISPYENAKPKILLGQDNCAVIATRELREINRHGIALSRSLLGWSIHGRIHRESVGPERSFVGCMGELYMETTQDNDSFDERLDEQINRYFLTENFGVSDATGKSKEYDHSMKTLEETTQLVEKTWETGLLWRNKSIPVVDSRTTARNRLVSLERRLDRNPEYAFLYYTEMERFINDGNAIKVESDVDRSRVWYLPHFGVKNPNKPGKLRLVFDAAARTAGTSLNDQLDAGPDLLQPLPAVLLRFRQFGTRA